MIQQSRQPEPYIRVPWDGGLSRRCASRQGFLYSSSKVSACSDFWQLASKWKFIVEVSGSWEGWLLLQERHRGTLRAFLGQPKVKNQRDRAAQQGFESRTAAGSGTAPGHQQGQREGTIGTSQPRVGTGSALGPGTGECPGQG